MVFFSNIYIQMIKKIIYRSAMNTFNVLTLFVWYHYTILKQIEANKKKIIDGNIYIV